MKPNRRNRRFPMQYAPGISFTDAQLHAIVIAADDLPVEKRATLLERVGGHLKAFAGRAPSDAQVNAALTTAMIGLKQTRAAVVHLDNTLAQSREDR